MTGLVGCSQLWSKYTIGRVSLEGEDISPFKKPSQTYSRRRISWARICRLELMVKRISRRVSEVRGIRMEAARTKSSELERKHRANFPTYLTSNLA